MDRLMIPQEAGGEATSSPRQRSSSPPSSSVIKPPRVVRSVFRSLISLTTALLLTTTLVFLQLAHANPHRHHHGDHFHGNRHHTTPDKNNATSSSPQQQQHKLTFEYGQNDDDIKLYPGNVTTSGRRLKRQYYPVETSDDPGIFVDGEGNVVYDDEGRSIWSSPSPCSRSCGGGVAFQEKICNNEFEQCAGERRYFSCNTQPCPSSHQVDFRSEQCSAFDSVPFEGRYYKWTPYRKAPNKCELNCMPVGERFYYRHKRHVIDGTKCDDEHEDICLNGKCLPVGCDNILGSSAREDKCRQCSSDRDQTTAGRCTTVEGVFDRNDLQVGYNDILLIPAGATNILVREKRPSNNYLALRNTSNSFFLNGNWRIDFPREIQFAGTIFHYERKPNSFFAPESIRCLGPLTEAIYVVILYQESNPGVEYEYSVSDDAGISLITEGEYSWTTDEFSECSESCGSGLRRRRVNCARRIGNNVEYVEEYLCDRNYRPTDVERCNEQPCPYRWATAREWSECSARCGKGERGHRTRAVFCEQRFNGATSVVDDSYCDGNGEEKPAGYEECFSSAQEECASWFVDKEWGSCSALCGEGEQRRTVACVSRSAETNETTVHDEEEWRCEGEKPDDLRPCFLKPCDGVDWIAGPFGKCSDDVELRLVYCSTSRGKIFPDKFCHEYRKPNTSRPCEIPDDDGVSKEPEPIWFAAQWGECLLSSCTPVDGAVRGVRTRAVFCGTMDAVTFAVTKVEESRCDAAKKYDVEEPCDLEEEFIQAECFVKAAWFVGPWGPCSKGTCEGVKSRTVLCVVGNSTSTDVSKCGEDDVVYATEDCDCKGTTRMEEVMPTSSEGTTTIGEGEEEDEGPCVPDEEDELLDYYYDILSSGSGGEEDGVTTTEMASSASGSGEDDGVVGTTTELVGTTTGEASGDEMIDQEGSTTTASGEGSAVSSGTEMTMMKSTSGSASGGDVAVMESTTMTSGMEDDVSGSGSASGEKMMDDVGSGSGSGSGDAVTSTGETTTSTSTTEDGGSTVSSTTSDESTTTDASSSEMTSTTTATTSDASSSEMTSTTTATTSDDEMASTSTTTGEPTTTSESTTTEETTTTSESTTTEEMTSTSTETSSSSESESTATTMTTEEMMTSTSTSTGSSSSSSPSSADTSTTTMTSSSSSTTSDVDYSSVSVGEEPDIYPNTDYSDVSFPVRIINGTDNATEDWSGSGSGSGSGDVEEEEDEESSASGISGSGEEEPSSGSASGDEESGDDVMSGVSSGSGEDDVSGSGSGDDVMMDVSGSGSGMTMEEEEMTSEAPRGTTVLMTSPTTLLPKCRKKKKPSPDCLSSEFGCCPDGKTSALAPFNGNCSIPKTCEETKFGCCEDGITPSPGPFKARCPSKQNCEESLFGCCPDGRSRAKGNNFQGCELDCENTTFGCCDDGFTARLNPKGRGCPKVPCGETKYGCCPGDKKNIAKGPNFKGCKEIDEEDCTKSFFKCCLDGKTPALGENDEGCPATPPCMSEEFGCCEDGVTSAHGANKEGCCLGEEFGCCTDNLTPAKGPNLQGCTCFESDFGCCGDNSTYARGPDGDCGCKFTEHGCCPDGYTTATGRDNEGCPCSTFKFGCCPDGTSVAKGPNKEGCGCEYAEFGCCPDNRTPKETEEDSCGCESSLYGCCPDGVGEASGEEFQGCEEVPIVPGDVCGLEKERGSCRNFTVKWFFDMEYGGCSRFWFGGCDGNLNKFNSQDECKAVCVEPEGRDACYLPKVSGPCEGYYPSWYYDAEREACHQFVYGGCLGNNNRFANREACEHNCLQGDRVDACDQVKVEGPCKGNFSRWYYDKEEGKCGAFTYGGCKGNNNNFLTNKECNQRCSKEGRARDSCFLPRVEGPCGEKLARWFYDQREQRCVPFYYSGCQGNANRFNSLDSCEQTCPPALLAENACVLPPLVGDCTTYTERYHFDPYEGRCKAFVYSGCGGNNNNFINIDECRNSCEHSYAPQPIRPGQQTAGQHHQQTVQHSAPPDQNRDPFNKGVCLVGPPDDSGCSSSDLASPSVKWFYDSRDGVCKQFRFYCDAMQSGNHFTDRQECEERCGDSQDLCSLPVVVGPCSGVFPQFHYDMETDACVPFDFGGCQGNANRFDSVVQCEQRCRKNSGATAEEGGQVGGVDPLKEYYEEVERRRQQQQQEEEERRRQQQQPTEDEEEERRRQYEDELLRRRQEEEEERRRQQEESPEEEEEMRRRQEYEDELRRRQQPSEEEERRRQEEEEEERLRREEEFERRRQEYEDRLRQEEEEEEGTTIRVESNDICSLPVEVGPCRASVPSYYFDPSTGRCTSFLYGGCQGNANRFESEEACERSCGELRGQDVCSARVNQGGAAAAAAGGCAATGRKWFFDGTGCAEYSGCADNNVNKFSSAEECEAVCVARQDVGKYGNDSVVKVAAICEQRVDTGPCYDGYKRWYFDGETCLPFVYGGCGGNLNRFTSFPSCVKYCQPMEEEGRKANIATRGLKDALSEKLYGSAASCTEETTRCLTLQCAYGTTRSTASDGCVRCDCTDPCRAVECPRGETCAVDFDGPQYQVRFRAVCRRAVKDGECPSLLRQVSGLCEQECVTDADCAADLKCCSNGCGAVCTRAVFQNETSNEIGTPPRIVSSGDDDVVSAEEGGLATLQCVARGDPKPNVFWDFNGERLSLTSGRYRTPSDDGSTLEIVGVVKKDGGVYTCTAENAVHRPARQDVTLHVTTPLSSRQARILEDDRADNKMTVNLGAPTSLRCFALGWPRPSVTWWRGERMLPFSSERYEQLRDHSLLIRLVSLRDLGPYTCQAYNGLGKAASWTVTVFATGPVDATDNQGDREFLKFVKVGPVQRWPGRVTPRTTPAAVVTMGTVATTTTATTTTTERVIVPNYLVPLRASISLERTLYPTGSEIIIPCEVEGYPTPSVHFYRDEAPLSLGDDSRVSVSGNELRIRNATVEDSGTYRCDAVNEYGAAHAQVSITVEGAYLHPNCTDNGFFANCKLIVKANYCTNKYYARFCCKSCTLAGQLPPFGPHLQEYTQSYFRRGPTEEQRSNSNQQSRRRSGGEDNLVV